MSKRPYILGFDEKIDMNARDIVEIVKESRLWEALTPWQKHDAIKHALNITYLSLTEEEIRSIVGEVHAG